MTHAAASDPEGHNMLSTFNLKKNYMKLITTMSNLCTWMSLSFLLLIVISPGCSKDDPAPSVFINSQPTQVSFNEVNKCLVPGGLYYTRFTFTIPYEASPGLVIDRILFSAEGSPEKEETDFDDSGTEITFDLCLKFGGAPKVDFTTTLVSTDDIKSSAKTVTINKPTGAN